MRRFVFDVALIGGVAAAALVVALDRLPSAPAGVAEAGSDGAVAAPIWLIDLDGDGAADLANPTQARVRGTDGYGSGDFHAARDGGRRKHEGADFIAEPGASVRAPVTGTVTAIGYAYDRDTYLRFVELTDLSLNLIARVFYIGSPLQIGDSVNAGDPIGAAQTLAIRYPFGMTNHVHVEISDTHGVLFDPAKILPPGGAAPVFAALKIHARQPAQRAPARS